jgi:predicted nuclease of predicted toxin-antitoxin system
VKLLFDQNLSPRLVRALAEVFPDSTHVRDVGLASADDDDVWAYAVAHGFLIVSKDSDFHQRSFVHGAPPKIVWVRLGNCTTAQVEAILRAHAGEIARFTKDQTESFLVLG